MAELRKYGVATTILFPLVGRGVVDFENTPVTFVAADTQIMKDEGAFVNTGSTPVHEGNGIYSAALTLTEMEAARIVVTVIDAATKAWEDQAIEIETYGHPSAQHRFDLNSAGANTMVEGKAVAGTLSTTEMTTDLTEATNDHFQGRLLIWTTGALKDQARRIVGYLGADFRLQFDAATEAPAVNDEFIII